MPKERVRTDYTQEEEKVRQELEEFFKRTGMPQYEFAAFINQKRQQIGFFLQRKITPEPLFLEDILKGLKSLQDQGYERSVYLHGFPFLETETARTIYQQIDICRASGEMGVIIGEPGVGKTTALKHYAAVRRLQAMLHVVPPNETISHIIVKLCEKLNIIANGTVMVLQDRIIDELKSRNEANILIYDEAQYLTVRHMNLLRYIHDETGVPIIFAGMRELYDRMMGRQGRLYAQLFSRINYMLTLNNVVSENDMRTFLAATGREFQPDAEKMIIEQRNRHGALRSISKGLVTTCNLVPAGPISKNDVIDGFSLLMGAKEPIKSRKNTVKTIKNGKELANVG